MSETVYVAPTSAPPQKKADPDVCIKILTEGLDLACKEGVYNLGGAARLFHALSALNEYVVSAQNGTVNAKTERVL